jgi:acyl-CoA reductase-like NAD-dependent aldehyde dehydrogenase
MSEPMVESRNPATGAVIAAHRLDDVSAVKAAIARSREVQPGWAALPYRERSRLMKRVRDYVVDHADAIALVIAGNNGKTAVDALATEILPAAMAVQYYRKTGSRLLRPAKVRGGNILMFNKRSRIIRKPFGVVGIISPWNYPFAIPFSEIVMALLAGNGVVLKVASDSLAVGEALAAVFGSAGLPEGLFAYVNLPGREAGEAFVDGGVDKLFFTGSSAVGRELMAKASSRLLPLVLELGGNDAAIVRADADLDRAVGGIVWAGFSNSGQSCGGAQRILVQHSVYDDFLARLKKRVESLRIGPAYGEDADMGCMTSLRQKRAVEAQVMACLQAGAAVFARSPLDPALDAGNYMAALVLTGVKPGMPVMTEEVFGPVIAILPYSTDEEAVGIANASPYGLTASVWSRDRSRALEMASRINAGAVMINDHLMSHGLAETPWGGWGESGIGRTHAEAGFLEMTQGQVLVDDILPGVRKDIFWHPYSAGVYRGIKSIADFLYGRGILRRLAAIPRLLKIFFRYWEK